MKSTNKSETYEAIRVRTAFPGVSIPPEENALSLKELSIQGVSTLPQSINNAEGKADELLKECRRCIRKRDFSTFLSRLDAYPALIEDRWVREMVFKLAKQDRLRRRSGRPDACYNIYPLIVVGLVEQLITRGQVPNREQAFLTLEALGIMSYERAKYFFYRARREKRFRAILLKSAELAHVVTAEDMAARCRDAETLDPGGKITRTAEDPKLGTVEITFETK